MRVPWRFLVGLVLGFAVAIAFFAGAIYSQLGVPTYSSQWIHDITQKQLRLAGQASGRRLLVVAGSNALFGINAAEIQQATGCPTFNLGTHAALPLDYRLDRLKQAVRSGDIVLFAWEYEYYQGIHYTPIFADYVVAQDPGYFRQMSLGGKIAFATRMSFTRLEKGWRNMRRPEFHRPLTPPYSPYAPITPGIDCLDDNGDEIFNTPDRQSPQNELSGADLLFRGLPPGRNASFDALARFIDWAHDHHVTVLATFPNILWQPAYDSPVAQGALRRIDDFYRSRGVPVIGTAQEAMLHSRSDFLDTYYHLDHEAALHRTERLIPHLRPYLSAPGE